ncbi:RSN1, partial [Symbiodinium sp. CCMP2592]
LLRLRLAQRALDHQPAHRCGLRDPEPNHPDPGPGQLPHLPHCVWVSHRCSRDQEARLGRELLGQKPEPCAARGHSVHNPHDRHSVGTGPEFHSWRCQRYLPAVPRAIVLVLREALPLA